MRDVSLYKMEHLGDLWKCLPSEMNVQKCALRMESVSALQLCKFCGAHPEKVLRYSLGLLLDDLMLICSTLP